MTTVSALHSSLSQIVSLISSLSNKCFKKTDKGSKRWHHIMSDSGPSTRTHSPCRNFLSPRERRKKRTVITRQTSVAPATDSAKRWKWSTLKTLVTRFHILVSWRGLDTRKNWLWRHDLNGLILAESIPLQNLLQNSILPENLVV